MAVGPFWVWFMVFKSKHHTTVAEGLEREREREREREKEPRVCVRRELEIRKDEI